VTSDKTFVVIPAFNEQARIGNIVRGVLKQGLRVVVVDDGSCDETTSVARSAGATVLRHSLNRGQGAALQTGISFSLISGANRIVTFDADGQHSIGDISRLLDPIYEGTADVTLGSRFLGESSSIPLARRILLRLAVVFTRVVSGARVTDTHNGLRAFSRRAAERLDIRLDRMAHASEIVDQVHQMGLPYEEVAVEVRYTEYSMAKGQRTSGAVRVLVDYLFGSLVR
jgi:glycosyltransferase involved in cell wall biosynthesis